MDRHIRKAYVKTYLKKTKLMCHLPDMPCTRPFCLDDENYRREFYRQAYKNIMRRQHEITNLNDRVANEMIIDDEFVNTYKKMIAEKGGDPDKVDSWILTGSAAGYQVTFERLATKTE